MDTTVNSNNIISTFNTSLWDYFKNIDIEFLLENYIFVPLLITYLSTLYTQCYFWSFEPIYNWIFSFDDNRIKICFLHIFIPFASVICLCLMLLCFYVPVGVISSIYFLFQFLLLMILTIATFIIMTLLAIIIPVVLGILVGFGYILELLFKIKMLDIINFIVHHLPNLPSSFLPSLGYFILFVSGFIFIGIPIIIALIAFIVVTVLSFKPTWLLARQKVAEVATVFSVTTLVLSISWKLSIIQTAITYLYNMQIR